MSRTSMTRPMAHMHAPGWAHALSRRRFLATASGAASMALGSTMWLPKFGHAAPPEANPTPNPISGGVMPFGVLIHHFPLPPTGTPLSQLTEPSEITDFNGFVGDTRIRGFGTGSGFPTLSFQADMGFMKGEYVAVDGRHHHGSFVFV